MTHILLVNAQKLNHQVAQELKKQKLVPVKTIKNMVIQVPIGTESQDEEQVIDNIATVLKSMENNLPNQKNNIGKTFIKLTMGAPVEVSDK